MSPSGKRPRAVRPEQKPVRATSRAATARPRKPSTAAEGHAAEMPRQPAKPAGRRVRPPAAGSRGGVPASREPRRSPPGPRVGESSHRALLEHASDSIIVTDFDFRVRDVNPRACEMFGYTREELLRLSVRDLLMPEELVRHPLEVESIRRGEPVFSQRWLRRRDGTSFTAETHASMFADGRVLAIIRDVTARERADQVLRESEARYRAVVEQASEGITLTDPQWRFLDANPQAIEMFGYSREELMRMSVRDIGVAEDLSTHSLHDQELRQGGTILTERPLCRKDGTIFTAEISARGLPNGSVVSVVRDITERRRIEQALLESEARFRSVFESDFMGMVFGTLGAAPDDANDYALRLLGYTRDDLLAGRMTMGAVMPPEFAQLREEAIRQARATGTSKPFETEFIRKDGTRVPVLTGAALIGTARDFAVGFALDLTDLRRTEQRLAESEQYLDRAQALAHVGTWDADLTTMTATYSNEMLRLHGLPPDTRTVTYADFLASIHPDDRPAVEQTIRRAMERPGEHSYEHRILRRDGSVRVVAATSETVLDASGRPVRIIGSVQDITGRRLLELQLLEAQRLESIGRLAGGVAHDFNNLLTVILGFTETLLEGLPAGDERRASAEQIRAAGLRAADLTQQLLAFGRRQVLRMQVLDLNAVLTEMQGILQRSVGEQIEVDISPRARQCLVRADRGQIEQVILNLALNARDAMPAGGRIDIVTGDAGAAGGEQAGPDAGWLQLAVSDTGTGMNAEVLAHIFEPFFTTKEVGRGTGLGLATVHGIVTQMGGRIEVNSVSGEGTSFCVFLPCAADEAGREEGAAAPVPVPSEARGEETVLLVEDERAVRRFVAEALRRRGYRVIEAADGDQAIDTAHGHAGAIHLLVTDLVMPGMTGRELARFLTHERPGLRVLFISGYSDERAEPRGGAGAPEAEAFLQKPFTPVVLARQVRQILDAPGPGPGPG
jgi:two-component system, cell cycle sensor histidine kinase and response regulator CckA